MLDHTGSSLRFPTKEWTRARAATIYHRAHLATVRSAHAVILESPDSSIGEIEWIGNKSPAYALNTKEKVKKVNIPTLIIHGDQDKIITPDHAQRIYENLKAKNKKIIIIKGGGHGNLRRRPEYKEIIQSFLSDIIKN